MRVTFNDYRWKFSHPDLPIDEDILREVLSAGDRAKLALRTEQKQDALAQFSTVRPGVMDAVATYATSGRIVDLIQHRDALADRLRRIDEAGHYRGQAEERERAVAALRNANEAINAEKSRQADAAAPQRAAVDEARRCARYALECGCKIPELAAWREGVDFA